MTNSTSYNNYFDTDDIDGALACMDKHGYCVIRKMIDQSLVDELKVSIDDVLDPDRDLPEASNRYHMMLAEACPSLWKLVQHPQYLNYVQKVHGTADLCLHRSAAILRTPGEQMGRWHTDHRGHIDPPKGPNDVLNRFNLPSGSWFYLNGSHPDRSGIAVIEDSHLPTWPGPEGFELTPDRSTFHRIGEAEDAGCNDMDVPGCVAVEADPGDLICFAALTYHTNMETHERRYSCGIGFRPKSIRIAAPWPLPQSALDMIEGLPAHLRKYADGYTSFDREWKP
ncbi:phytanoyl-CoA dioxygenase family protein [bacterium]|nr:phytanoyl-CoA dioxygenase family protein [bacterium]